MTISLPPANSKPLLGVLLAALAACLLSMGLLAPAAAQTPITGEPQGNDFGWVPPSTNALNYAKQVPGRIGQDAPYVLFNSNAPDSVTLDFHNPGPGLAFFEYRIDGVPAGTSSHPVVTGDTIHSGIFVDPLTDSLGEPFTATQYVDVRLALGDERDWDFDWVRFYVQPQAVTAIPTLSQWGLLLLAMTIGGLAVWRRKNMA